MTNLVDATYAIHSVRKLQAAVKGRNVDVRSQYERACNDRGVAVDLEKIKSLVLTELNNYISTINNDLE